MTLITPYGGNLVDLFLPPATRDLPPSIQISERSRCDLELLATGGFSPLDHFMSHADYDRVLDEMRLANGMLFPIPITLPVHDDVNIGQDITLRGPRNEILAVMTVEEIFDRRDDEALRVFGTNDTKHPLVAEMASWGRRAISGPLRVIDVATPRDFRELRRTPREVRALLERVGQTFLSGQLEGQTGMSGPHILNVVAFQTRNPMHRAHEELTKRAIEAVDGVLLLHPSVGMTKPGDVDHMTRVRTYKALEQHYPPGRMLLSLLPLAMRMAGPREALWHAIIRRNFGANHFIVGRDHASPGAGFYGPYDAQELVAEHAAEIGMTMIPFRELVYVAGEDRYEEASRVPAGAETRSISGTQVRDEYLGK